MFGAFETLRSLDQEERVLVFVNIERTKCFKQHLLFKILEKNDRVNIQAIKKNCSPAEQIVILSNIITEHKNTKNKNWNYWWGKNLIVCGPSSGLDDSFASARHAVNQIN